MKCVITVLGKDRRGIVARIATCLNECYVNIEEMNQTRISGFFTMTMIADLDTSKTSFNDAQQQLLALGKELGMQISFQREDVFQFMHSV